MKKKIISIALSAVMCMSAVTCATVTAEATTCNREKISVQNNLSLGKGETVPISVDTAINRRSTERVYSHSHNTSIASINDRAYFNKYNYATFKLTGKNTGNTKVRFCVDGFIDGGDNDDAYVNVKVYNAPRSITLNCENVKLGKGESVYVSEHTNSGSYANAANLKWTTSNSNGKILSTSGNRAKVSGMNKGNFKINVSTYNGQWDAAGCSVYNAPSSVKLSKTSLTLNKGRSYTISESTNSGSYANAANLEWVSLNTKVATVTKGSGNKATIKAVGKGTAYIGIITYNGKTAKCKVTVK